MSSRKAMSVQDLINELEKYNPNAMVTIMANGAIRTFDIVYGHNGDETFDSLVTPKTCNQVSFYLPDLDMGVG